MDKLIKSIYSPEHARKWDKGLIDSKVEPLRGESKSCFYSYTCYKGSLGLDSRDFYEKAIAFEHNGKYYRYSAFVPNSPKLGPNGEPIRKDLPTAKTIRGRTLINVGIIERVENGEIHVKTLAQCDMGMKVMATLANKAVTTTTKKWYTDVNKYYMANRKNL